MRGADGGNGSCREEDELFHTLRRYNFERNRLRGRRVCPRIDQCNEGVGYACPSFSRVPRVPLGGFRERITLFRGTSAGFILHILRGGRRVLQERYDRKRRAPLCNVSVKSRELPCFTSRCTVGVSVLLLRFSERGPVCVKWGMKIGGIRVAIE